MKPHRPTSDELLAAALITKIAAGPFIDKVFSSSRKSAIAISRGIAMYVIQREFGLTTIVIGKMFGRDHSTVTHWCQVIEQNNRFHIRAINVQREYEQMKPFFVKDKIYDKLTEGLR